MREWKAEVGWKFCVLCGGSDVCLCGEATSVTPNECVPYRERCVVQLVAYGGVMKE
jgi:hypothetical protein